MSFHRVQTTISTLTLFLRHVLRPSDRPTCSGTRLFPQTRVLNLSAVHDFRKVFGALVCSRHSDWLPRTRVHPTAESETHRVQ